MTQTSYIMQHKYLKMRFVEEETDVNE